MELTDSEREALAFVAGLDRSARLAAVERIKADAYQQGRADEAAVNDREFGNLRWIDGHEQGLKDGCADLAAQVAAVRDKWAEYRFYEVAAMQLRNSFVNELTALLPEADTTPREDQHADHGEWLKDQQRYEDGCKADTTPRKDQS